MTLRSMTGYGRGHASMQGIDCNVELRSVNRKQLDIKLGISKELYAVESKIKKLIQGSVSRGWISGEISISYRGDTRKASVRIDEQLAAIYVSKLREAADRLHINSEWDASLLLKLPDVVRRETPDIDAEVLWSVVKRSARIGSDSAIGGCRSTERSGIKS